MRTLCWPVCWCVKTENSALKSEDAWLTGIETASQSPAGEIVVAVRPFAVSHSLTSEVDSAAGFTNASTYRNDENYQVK